MKKRIVLLFSLIGLLLVTIVSTSFALFTKSNSQDGINQITTYNCLDISIEGENELNLTNSYPIKDEEGVLQAPYLFTIKNNCDHYVGVDLGVEYQEESTINVSLVKATLNKPTEGIIPQILSSYTKIQETDSETGLPIENAKYIMIHEGLPAGDEQTFEYRMWIDYSVEDLSPSDKLKVKIVAIGTVQSEDAAPKNWWSAEDGTLLAALRDNNSVRKPLTTPGRQIILPTESVLASADDDYGTSYYYRGNVQNNYLVFANKCWRIVRVTGDGSIKLVLHNNDGINCNISDNTLNFAKYDGEHYQTTFNYEHNYNGSVGFMYGNLNSDNYNDEHNNINDSEILKKLKLWYDLNGTFTSTEIEKLSDVIWCADKSLGTGLGFGLNATFYGTRVRLFPNEASIPSLVCPNAGTDGKISKYTAEDNINGNGMLKTLGNPTKYYKIGLLTGDEAVYAGGIVVEYNATFKSKFSNYYLYNGYYYWLISPVDKYSSGLAVSTFNIRTDGSLCGFQVSSNYALRPSIALVSSVTISSGNGTINNPYVISV